MNLPPRLHLNAPITDPALPDDGASSAHRHHPLREHPRISCCQAEHPRVRTTEEHRHKTRRIPPLGSNDFSLMPSSFQPPSGESNHHRPGQLVSVLAHKQAQRRQ